VRRKFGAITLNSRNALRFVIDALSLSDRSLDIEGKR
jgi:hypothetical protein